MKKLLLTLVITTSTASLPGMENTKENLFPAISSPTYLQLSELLLPELARHIVSLQLATVITDLEKLSLEIEQYRKKPREFMQCISELIKPCDYNLAHKLFKPFFPQAQISICAIKDVAKRTSLHYAIKNNSPEVAQILINIAGNNVLELLTMQDLNRKTALHHAICKNSTENAKLLLDAAGINAWILLQIKDINGMTALHHAVDNNNSECVRLILDAAGNNAGTLLTMQRDSGWTVLHYAVRNDNTESVIKLLLDTAGDNVWTLLTLQDNEHEGTALDFAACLNKTENVKLLLNAAGNRALDLMSTCNKYGENAFDIASPEVQEVMRQYMQNNNH